MSSVGTSTFRGGWVVVRTKARREAWAGQNIERQGVEVYAPRILVRGRGRGAAQRQALFPGYLFADLPEGPWRFLTGTYGVSNLVMAGSIPAVMPPGEIERMRSLEDEAGNVVLPERPEPQPGDQVRVRGGPFEGYVGICSDSPASDRTRVLMEFLGGSTSFLFYTQDLDVIR